MTKQEIEYRNNPAVNQSLLCALDNPKSIGTNSDKSHFRIGGAVDMLLTQPDEFDNEYLCVEASKVGGMMGTFIENLPTPICDVSLIDPEEYRRAFDATNLKSYDATVKKFEADKDGLYKTYWQALSDADNSGKTLITSEQLKTVQHCVDLLKSCEDVSTYFGNTNGFYQVPIYFKFSYSEMSEDDLNGKTFDVDGKALIDGIIVDHDSKTVQPFDLKTSSDHPLSFVKSFMKWKYFIQAAWYQYAVEAYCHSKEGQKFLGVDYTYVVLPIQYIVVGKKHDYCPVIWDIPENLLEGGMMGFEYKGRTYKGVVNRVSDYLWHIENNYWDMSKELFDTNARQTLNIDIQLNN